MEHSASAQFARSAAQRLDRNLLFQIFDYLRDGRAFLQCEATCTDFRSLLREESGIGQKLWQARPIAYGARIFATGGIVYTEAEEEDLEEQLWAGTVGWAERHNREISDGGREVVLGFACLDAIGAAQRSGGAIVTTLAGEQWTSLLNRLHRWEGRPCDRFTSRHAHYGGQRPLDMFSSDVVLAATESIEAWIIGVMEKALLCANHRRSDTVTEADLRLAGICANDLTIRGTAFPGLGHDRHAAISLTDPAREFWRDPRRASYFPSDQTRRTSGEPLAELLAELDVATQERIIRTLARRAGVGAYDGFAYERLWRLLLLRLCLLLERVDEVYLHMLPQVYFYGEPIYPTYEAWEASRHRPSLETLAHVLQNGSGPIDPPPPREYAPFRDEDDGSFRSGDCPATSDDDDSSIGDESAPPDLGRAPWPDLYRDCQGCLNRIEELASLRASGALTEAEFARARAHALGIPHSPPRSPSPESAP